MPRRAVTSASASASSGVASRSSRPATISKTVCTLGRTLRCTASWKVGSSASGQTSDMMSSVSARAVVDGVLVHVELLGRVHVAAAVGEEAQQGGAQARRRLGLLGERAELAGYEPARATEVGGEQ